MELGFLFAMVGGVVIAVAIVAVVVGLSGATGNITAIAENIGELCAKVTDWWNELSATVTEHWEDIVEFFENVVEFFENFGGMLGL